MATSAPIYPRLANLTLGGWHGLSTHRVLVVGETSTRYRIRALTKTRLAGRFRYLETAAQTLVPRRAITFLTERWIACGLCNGGGKLLSPAVPPVPGLDFTLGAKGDACWDCHGLGGWPESEVDQYVSVEVST